MEDALRQSTRLNAKIGQVANLDSELLLLSQASRKLALVRLCIPTPRFNHLLRMRVQEYPLGVALGACEF